MNQEDILASYKGWLLKVASRMTTRENVLDLAQEGWIGMWRALKTHDPAKGPLDAWLKFKAVNTMKSVVLRPRLNETPTDDEQILDGTYFIIEESYFDGQVNAAVDSLPHREKKYVISRFWGHLPPSQLEKTKDGPIWRSAKSKLAAKLEHLKELV